MAELDDKTLRNINERLREMDRQLATDYQKTMDLAKAFKQGFSTQQLDAFLGRLNKINRKEAAKLNVMFNLVDINGTPITTKEALRRIEQIQRAINKNSAQTQINGRVIPREAMANELSRYKNALSVLGMSTSEQFDLIRRNVNRVNKSMAQTKNIATSILPTLQRLGSAFGIAFSVQGLVQFGKKLVETRGEFEMQFVAMKQIIGDVDAATKIWNQTLQQALQSPKTFKELVTYTKQLAAYRIETEKLFDTTKMLADVSAGLGVEMGRLILAYGQVKSANYLRASEVRQFTEAGVNIYGELAKYFSEIEGRAIGTAEVVERVTKRMVLFSDVERIFQRMTAEGGAFFNMQEVQSDTVKGQIMKLHDAYDQMLNTIGEANQGTIREMVEALNELVRNWRDAAAFLKTNVQVLMVLLPLIVTYRRGAKLAAGETWTWSRAMKQISLEIAFAGKSLTGFSFSTKLGTAAVNMFRGAVSLAKTALKTFAPFLIIEGIAWFITKMRSANAELERFREELKSVSSENTQRMNEEIYGYDILVKKLEKANEGTLERKEILNEISSKYGKYLDFVITEKTTVEELAGAYDHVANSLRNYTAEKIREEAGMKVQKSMYDEYNDLIENLTGTRLSDLNGNTTRKITKAEAKNVAKLIQQTLEQYGTVDVGEILKQYFGAQYDFRAGGANAGIWNDAVAFVQEWKDLNAELQSILDDIEQTNPIFKTNDEYLQYKANVEAASEELLRQKQYYEEQVEAIKQAKIESWQAEDLLHALRMANTREEIEIRKKYGLITDEQYRSEMARLNGRLDDYESDYNKRLEQALFEQFGIFWRETKKDARDMFNYVVSTEDNLQQGTSQRNKQLKESYEGLKDSLEQYTAALTAAETTGANEASLEAINANINHTKLMMEAIELAARLRGIDLTDKNEKNKKTDISKLISLLKEMNSEYEKLTQTAYGYAKANSVVRISYRDAFKEIFGAQQGTEGATMLDEAFTMIDWDKIDITNKRGVATALKNLEQYITDNKLWDKFSKDAQKMLKKAYSQMDAEANINVQVKIREDFAREIENMFSDYELTLDLQKINLPPDIAKDFLGFDNFTSLAALNKRLAKFREQMGVNYDEKDMQLYETWMKKVTDKVYAMRKERAKEYTKYLEQELSQRAKLAMQYTTDVAFVKSNFKDGEQKDLILHNLEENYTNAIHELKWKAFKESDFYVEMMQDLTSMPNEYLEMMKTKLDELVREADKIPPKVLKEILRSREKIIDAQVAMRPIRALSTSTTEIHKMHTKGVTDAKGKKVFLSDNISKARKELGDILIAREEEIQLTQAELDKQETLLGYLTAQENIHRTINELTVQGFENISESSTAADIQSEIERQQKCAQSLVKPTQDGVSEETFQKRLRQYEEEQAAINNIINLLILLKSQREEADQSTAALSNLGITVTESANRAGTFKSVKELKKKMDDLNKAQDKDHARLAYFKQYNKAVHGLAQNIATVTGKVKGVGNAIYGAMDAMGKTDEITDLWKDFGNAMVDSITNVLNLIPALITGYTAAGVAINSAMGIIGLIAEAIQLTITLITFLTQLSDAQKDKEIDALQDKIDALKDAYERLEKAIEKTWDTVSYMSNYSQMVDNLKQQIEALKKQRDAEQSKKKSDEDKIKDYNDAIQDAEDKIEELRQKYIEVFGGLGEVNYRSAAQEFVDAWKEAFLETGDGLKGLQDHFNEFLQEWFVKQATMRIAGRMLEPLFTQIDKAVDEYNAGGTTVLLGELNAVKEKFSTIAPQLSEALEQLAGMWGLGEGEGGLSGLAAGIQGMSEEQANILEAYWNSVRMYTASIDMNVARIVDILGAGTGDRTNPQLQQLEIIARNTTAINSLFDSVVAGTHTKGGKGIKVFMN